MAAVGDVLVKFVADFAEFATGMEKSRKQIETWAESIAKAGQSIEGFISLAKRIAGALALEEAARRVLAWGAAIEAAAVANDKLARSSGLTSEQIQALQIIATKTGQSIDELTKIGKQNTDWLEQTTAAYKTHGLILDESVSKPMVEAAEKTELFNRKLDVLFARVYGPIKGSVMGELANETDRLTKALTALSAYDSLLDKIRVLVGAQGVNLSSPNAPIEIWAKDIEKLNAELPKLNAELDALRNNSLIPPGARQALIAEREAIIAAKEAQRDYLAARVQAGAPATTLPTITVPALRPTGGGGGGGTTVEDTIERQIKRYQDLAAAAQRSMDIVRTSTDKTVESLTRQAEVQQQIDEAVTNFIRRYPQATKAQTEAFTAAVTAQKQLNDARQQFLKDSTAAEATEKRLGDGVKAQSLGMVELNKQLASARLNTTTYDRAVKELTESTQQSALAARRYDDDLGSLEAGFQHAANAYARQNDLFSQGEQVFGALSTAMTDGLKALEGQSDKTFGQIALNFANMLADMAIKAALSQVFKAVFGAVTGSPGIPIIGGSQGWDVLSGAILPTARASGGPVSAGQSYVVGESGPELFVPQAAGNIVPSGASGGRGGDNVTVNVDMNSTQGTSDPAKMLQFGRQMKAAIKDVIQNEKRPGGSLYSRVSA